MNVAASTRSARRLVRRKTTNAATTTARSNRELTHHGHHHVSRSIAITSGSQSAGPSERHRWIWRARRTPARAKHRPWCGVAPRRSEAPRSAARAGCKGAQRRGRLPAGDAPTLPGHPDRAVHVREAHTHERRTAAHEQVDRFRREVKPGLQYRSLPQRSSHPVQTKTARSRTLSSVSSSVSARGSGAASKTIPGTPAKTHSGSRLRLSPPSKRWNGACRHVIARPGSPSSSPCPSPTNLATDGSLLRWHPMSEGRNSARYPCNAAGLLGRERNEIWTKPAAGGSIPEVPTGRQAPRT